MPNISIIIPNYNHENYLNQRIESVLDQSYQDYEIIILDDCSTDNSKEIIEKHRSHPKVTHVVYNKQNSGSTFKQWKKGIELAKGKYIWIAESDDYSEKCFLNKCLIALEFDKEINLCFAQSYRVDENNYVISDLLDCYTKKFNSPFIQNGKSYIKDFLWNENNIFNASAVIFKKDLYPTDENHIVKFKFVGDWLAYIKILETGKIAYLPDRLNYFRTHRLSVTAQLNRSKIHLIESYFILSYIKTNRLYNSRKKIDSRFNYLAGLILHNNPNLNDLKYLISLDNLFVFRASGIILKYIIKKGFSMLKK